MNPEPSRPRYLTNFPGSDTTADEFEFLKAMERFQRAANRRYPTCREVLFVLRSLGYRKLPPADADPPAEPTPSS